MEEVGTDEARGTRDEGRGTRQNGEILDLDDI